MPRLSRRSWPAALLGSAGLLVLGVTIAGAQGDGGPRGTDPLSPAEVQAAVEQTRPSTGAEAGGLDEDDVVLLVERHREGKADEGGERRRADVYVYSYDDDVLTVSVVDTATGAVQQTNRLRDTQLPLIPEEADRALELALADPGFDRALATAYRQATGTDLADPATDLEIQPIVFRADSDPRTEGAARECGRHRCAQLMIQTTDHVLVDILPIIDLSAERVLSPTGAFS